MTQRERQTANAGSEVVPRPPSGQTTPRPPSAADAPERSLPWDDLFGHATPTQQKEILDLARRQGIVYAHQLPAIGNGTIADLPRQFLARLLAGKRDELTPVSPAALEFIDSRLDAVQREAVARAVFTPDIFLLQGLPGTGKSLVTAEIVTQAARRGERVLLLGCTPASIDRVLEQVAGQPEICAVRCVAASEKVEAIPAGIRDLTLAARSRAIREDAIPAARREVETAQQRRDRRRQDEPVFRQLEELAEAWSRLEDQAAALNLTREALAAEVERDAAVAEAADETNAAEQMTRAIADLARCRREAAAQADAAEAVLAQRRQELEREKESLVGELEILQPLGQAKQQGRWWTKSWWRATLAGKVPTRLSELEQRCRGIEASLAALNEEKSQLAHERFRAEQSFHEGRQQQAEAEIARRVARLDEQAAALEQDRKLLLEKWQLRCRDLAAGTAPPAALAGEAVEKARTTWLGQLQSDEEQIVFARRWAAGLETEAETFPARLVEHANLVAAVGNGFAADAYFGDSAGICFDLLVFEEAHQLTESEFVAAARRARRWVLVGEPEPDGPARTPPTVEPRHKWPRSRAGSGPLPASLSPRWFHRLWQWLHFDPRTLPYAWEREGDRLCCRLRALSPEQRQWLECERVADFPDIELRILASPRSRPVLVEVVFPPALSIYQAKEYIFRELQELPVRARSHSLRWHEEADRLVLQMSQGDVENVVAVDLGVGVRELVGSHCPNHRGESGTWHTSRLEFDRKAGWQRPTAEEWIQRHIGARDLGRTVRLDVPYRMHPELAAVLSHWLFAGAYEIPPLSAGNGSLPSGAPVQFVPVPSPTEGNGWSKRDNGRRGRAARGGAGFELDLADPRHRDRLPSELRPELPAQGLVNYLEAQAVVRALEKLFGSEGDKLSVAVLALYPAQAELIRCLIRRSPVLASGNLDLRVGLPEAFRERECTIALLSLTRSHHHRAVTFGQNPHVLALGLTRARSRLVLFGDPGTLARRVQWEGAVDHLDPISAARESELLSHLVRHFHSDGEPLEAAAVPEGTRT